MKKIGFLVFGFCLVCVMALPVNAVAAYSEYLTREAFNAALDGAALTKTVQGWDDITAGTAIVTGDEIDGVTYDPVTINLIFGIPVPGLLNCSVQQDSNHLSPENALAKISTIIPSLTDTILLSFDTPVNAFGISFLPYAGETFALSFADGTLAGAPDPFPNVNGGVNNGQFAGFISDTAYSGITLTIPLGMYYIFDDMTYSQVPIPAAFWLFGSGLVFFAAYGKKETGIRILTKEI